MTIDESVGWVIDKFEGHLFTDDPVDSGGATKHGITQRTYAYWRRKYGDGLGVTQKDVRNLTFERAVQIGVDVFAKESSIDKILDWRVQLLTYDFAFHSGASTAIKALQQALGIPAEDIDGVIGPQTLTALVEAKDIYRVAWLILTSREEFMQDLVTRRPSQRRFVFGWWIRTTKLQRLIAEG